MLSQVVRIVSLMRAIGIHGSIKLRLIVSLTKVLKRNLRLFLFSSSNEE